MSYPELLLLPLVGLILALQQARRAGAGWPRALATCLAGGLLGAGGFYLGSTRLGGPDRQLWILVLTLVGGMLGPLLAALTVRPQPQPAAPTEQPPTFRYHPDPLGTGVVLVDPETVCDCCHRARGLIYEGPFHSQEEVDSICPWCIQDGSAADRFQGSFNEGLEEGPDPEAVAELLRRTPGYPSWQEPVWPVHCQDFCAYLGELQLEEFSAKLREEFAQDLEEIESEFGVLGEGLSFYLFRCLHCGKHRLHADAS